MKIFTFKYFCTKLLSLDFRHFLSFSFFSDLCKFLLLLPPQLSEKHFDNQKNKPIQQMKHCLLKKNYLLKENMNKARLE